jgi:hypothetical protein
VAAIGPLNLNLRIYDRFWIIWRPGGALRWKGEDCQLGRLESNVWKADTFKAVAPHLCQLRTDGLVPVSK